MTCQTCTTPLVARERYRLMTAEGRRGKRPGTGGICDTCRKREQRAGITRPKPKRRKPGPKPQVDPLAYKGAWVVRGGVWVPDRKAS